MTHICIGYGLKVGEDIHIRTVSDTVLAVKVNALYLYFGFWCMPNPSDAYVDDAWERELAAYTGTPLKIIKVLCTELEGDSHVDGT